MAFETLEYIRRGGRIGEVAAMLGSRLHVQPVFSLAVEKLKVVGVARSQRKVAELMLRLMRRHIKDRPISVSTFRADALEKAEWLGELICQQFRCQELFITEFIPAMGVHSRPGTFEVGYCIRE
ncbi:MAG: DegV family protein [Anaerolineae bacterium]|nr:DegV family protein [Anaerolineae bacterium]